jgi:hypothetical protein
MMVVSPRTLFSAVGSAPGSFASVLESEPKEAEGEEFAYRVDFYHQTSVPLLRRDENLE